jgi:hypothetical protein
MTIGSIGNVEPPGGRRRGGGLRRRDIRNELRARNALGLARDAAPTSAKRTRVIRVPVPIDVATIVTSACGAFAFATPLRVEHLILLAVGEALGTRAPQDKRERVLRSTLAGLRAGEFVVDVDGRRFERAEDVVVCAGTATLRFFARRTRHERGAAR